MNTDTNPEDIADITTEFLNTLQITDDDIQKAEKSTETRKRQKYVLTPARIAQQQAMRERAWEVKREKKVIRDQILNEKLKEYRAKAEAKMKQDIIRSATRIMRNDLAVQKAVRQALGDTEYNPLIYNELLKIIGNIQAKIPQQTNQQYSFS